MNYDFTTILDRAGHDALAVDVIPVPDAKIQDGFSRIPMWVADMNFPTFPGILKAVEQRLHQPHFGYFRLPQTYFDAIINWQKERHDFDVKEAHINYENGVLGGFSSVIQAYTKPGDPILVHSPTYIGFTATVNNTGRKLVHSPLVQDKQGIWRMDYANMDELIRKYNIKVCIFCSPHNPTGRVWEKEEIEKAMEVYRKNDCIVISDEIWSDLILFKNRHIPTQSVSDDARNRTAAFYAPSKTFSLAGLVGSYHVIFNKDMADRVQKIEDLSHYNMANVLSVHALIGAYTDEGASWVDQLCKVLETNINLACDFFQEHAPDIAFAKPQGTYMLYLDCAKYVQKKNITMDALLKKGIEYGVLWQDGRPFRKEDTIRLNLALPTSMLKEALSRLKTYVL